tara:strand:- start:14741 stop:15100 length:360 start_codon:yes stop_codon:yes gene_type:complete
MKFTDWKNELEECNYVVTDDLVTNTRGDVLAGKDPYGGHYVNDSRIQDILSKELPVAPVVSVVSKPKNKVKKAAAKATALVMSRARNKDGHYIADDPATEVNEAWVVKTVKAKGKKDGV